MEVREVAGCSQTVPGERRRGEEREKRVGREGKGEGRGEKRRRGREGEGEGEGEGKGREGEERREVG